MQRESRVQRPGEIQGQSTRCESGNKTPKLKKSFVYFHTKEEPQVKDLSDSLSRVGGRLHATYSRIAMTSPYFS